MFFFSFVDVFTGKVFTIFRSLEIGVLLTNLLTVFTVLLYQGKQAKATKVTGYTTAIYLIKVEKILLVKIDLHVMK